jgi:hypothetical protein
LLLVFAVALIATACSSEDAGEATSTTTQPQTTTTTEPAAPASTTTMPPTTTTPTTTAAPATTTTSGGIVPGEDPDVDAVVLAYQVVFSSDTTYEEKVPYLVDPTGLEDTVEQYGATGEAMGGIELATNAVSIDGDVAAVQYDLLFGGTPTYPDLTGDAVLVDNVWKVTREMFCGMMTSARVGCPPS